MFYIDVDLDSSKIYIFPISQIDSARYLISIGTRYEAENLLRKLNASLLKPPPCLDDFRLEGEVFFANIKYQSYLQIVR